MATIRKRGAAWQAQVRRQGYPLLTKSFTTHADAQAWARDQERSIDRAELPTNQAELKTITLWDLLDRYEREITPAKRGADRERSKLSVLKRHSVASATLNRLSGAMVASYRDDRLQEVSGGTVRRELAILRHCFEVARKEWGFRLISNPVREINLPKPSEARTRRLEVSDVARFWVAVNKARSQWFKPLIILAVETGMRRGELLSIEWTDVDLSASTVRLRTTKNGYERTVPLTPRAIQTIEAIVPQGERVFPVKPFTVRQAWLRLLERAEMTDLRFHDLRHEAVSRFFEMGLSAPEVALISGHRDMRMLARYTHLRPAAVAEKLARLSSSAEVRGIKLL